MKEQKLVGEKQEKEDEARGGNKGKKVKPREDGI